MRLPMHGTAVSARTKRKLIVKTLCVVFALVGAALTFSTGNELSRHLCAVFFKHGNGDPYGVWEDFYRVGLDYLTEERVDTRNLAPKQNDVAYVLTITDCPDREWWQLPEKDSQYDPNHAFFDAAAVLKHSICQETGEGSIVNDKYNATMYAVVHEDAIECEGPGGELYDRIGTLEDLGYNVKIHGSPIRTEDISAEYVRDNIEKDVGINDLAKLWAYTLTDHPLAVMVDYTTLVMQSLNDVYDELLSSDKPVAFSMNYAKEGENPTGINRGVNTGFVVVKPSPSEYMNLINTYESTPYDPVSGWDNSGIANFDGSMGTSGLLAYYYRDKTPQILDRCVFGNDHDYPKDAQGRCRDGTLDCDDNVHDCRKKDVGEVKVARLLSDICGRPHECPEDGSLPTNSLCWELHKKWFEKRLDYEENYYRGPKGAHTGEFHFDRFMGYCSTEGSEGYQPIVPDKPEGPKKVPDPIPPVPVVKCAGKTCTSGYMSQDCECVTDPCDACPEGTLCQRGGNGSPPMCIDCECGFCNYAGNSCCKFNGVNNCNAATNDKECKLQMGFFPGWSGQGQACSGVELSMTATPNGCGCQPNEGTPCTYERTGFTVGEGCFVCRASDLLPNGACTVPTSGAISCKDCIETACAKNNIAACFASAKDVHDMQDCLGDKKNKNDECRATCATSCKVA